MEIHVEKCEVNKRRLVFNCSIDEHDYSFEYDDWGNDTFVKGGKIITAYKHCLQAYISTHLEGCIFIDRQYKHNHSYEVYFDGIVYTVGNEDQPNLIGIPKPSTPTK